MTISGKSLQRRLKPCTFSNYLDEMENRSDQPVLINHNLDVSVGILSLATVGTVWASRGFGII